jgi:urease accessory protein
MSSAGFPSDDTVANHRHDDAVLARALAGVRADVDVSVSCAATGPRTHLTSLTERGGYRAKFPRTPGTGLEAVIVNSGGGVAGGDRVRLSASAGAGARLTVSTATAERIYRSLGPSTEINVRLQADAGTTLGWLPQPTILFSGARLDRRFEVDLAADARLILAETFVFGRIASGEIMGDGMVRDRWRIRRDGRLAFAETTRLDGDLAALLDRPTIAGGARATALIVVVAPDAEDLRDGVREALAGSRADHGVSAWDGLLVVRALASGLDAVHDVVQRVVRIAMGGTVPRAWAG